jgi:hypothetical protein
MFIYRPITVYIDEEGTQKVVSVTYGSSNEHIYLSNDSKMRYLLAKIIKWKRGKSTQVIGLYINMFISK